MSIISIYYKSNSMIVASCCCIMPEAGVRGGGGGGGGHDMDGRAGKETERERSGDIIVDKQHTLT